VILKQYYKIESILRAAPDNLTSAPFPYYIQKLRLAMIESFLLYYVKLKFPAQFINYFTLRIPIIANLRFFLQHTDLSSLIFLLFIL